MRINKLNSIFSRSDAQDQTKNRERRKNNKSIDCIEQMWKTNKYLSSTSPILDSQIIICISICSPYASMSEEEEEEGFLVVFFVRSNNICHCQFGVLIENI